MNILTAEGNIEHIEKGILEVYDRFPWVSKDEEGLRYCTVDEMQFGYKYWYEGEEVELPYGGLEKCYINLNHIMSAEDGTQYDTSSVIYPYCKLTMLDGRIFYLACNFRDIFEKSEDDEDEM